MRLAQKAARVTCPFARMVTGSKIQQAPETRNMKARSFCSMSTLRHLQTPFTPIVAQSSRATRFVDRRIGILEDAAIE